MLTNTHPALRRCWHPVALVSDVPADGMLGVRLLGERWLLARLGGELVALRDRCPHRLVPLSAGKVVDDTVQCAYHGYRFGADGKCTAIPALPDDAAIPPKACVDTARVIERFGMVWLSLVDDPLDSLLDDAGYTRDDLDHFVAGPYTTHVSAGILTDNFIDAAHFPWLHAGTFGADDDGRPSLESRRDGWRVTVHDRQMVDGAHLDAAKESLAQYTIGAPFAVELRLDRQTDEGTTESDYIWSFACPVDDTTSLWWMVHAYPLGGNPAKIAAALDLQERVGVEDLWILEQMEDPNLPLDVRAEVHTKADAGCLDYRRMMIDLTEVTR